MQLVAISDLNPGTNPELVTQSTVFLLKKDSRPCIMVKLDSEREKQRKSVCMCVFSATGKGCGVQNITQGT